MKWNSSGRWLAAIGTILFLLFKVSAVYSEEPEFKPESAEQMIYISAYGSGDEEIEFYEPLKVVPRGEKWKDNELPPYEPEKKGKYVKHYALEFLGANSEVLYRFPFTCDLTDRIRGEPDIPEGKSFFETEYYYFDFSGRLPFPDKTATIVLKDEKKVLATIKRTIAAPILKLGKPRLLSRNIIEVPWMIDDPDSDKVIITGRYVSAGDSSYIADRGTITLRPKFGYSDPEMHSLCAPTVYFADSFRVDSTDLPGGEECYITIAVSDGINEISGKTESIKIPIKPPDIYIYEPADGSEVNVNEGVTFNSFVAYKFFGTQEGFRVKWTSDKDGKLGEGADIHVEKLSVGKHKITLHADDGKGCTGQKSLTIIARDPIAERYAIPPKITIEGFRDGANVDEGEEVLFKASAQYHDGGGENEFAITWISDIDGELGKGQLRMRNLLAGKHTITARADNGKGCKGEASASLTIIGSGKPSPDFYIDEKNVIIEPEPTEPKQRFKYKYKIRSRNAAVGTNYMAKESFIDLENGRLLGGGGCTGVITGDPKRDEWERFHERNAPERPFRLVISVSCEIEKLRDLKDNTFVREFTFGERKKESPKTEGDKQ